MAIECTALPVLSSIRQASGCLWHYKLQHVMISIVAAMPFCMAGLIGWLDPVFSMSAALTNVPEGFNFSFFILVMTTFIWAFPVIILWHRLYLLGPEHLIRRKIWPLITRSLKIISHSLIFFGIGLLAAIAMTGGILYLRLLFESDSMTGTITEMGQLEFLLYILGAVMVSCFALLIALRFSMAFSSQAIGKKLGFTTSWQMTRKNTFRMLMATLVGVIPLLAADGLLLWLGNQLFQIDLLAGTAPKPYMIYLFVLFTAPLLSLPLAMLCSLTASYYRHCGCAEFRPTQP